LNPDLLVSTDFTQKVPRNYNLTNSIPPQMSNDTASAVLAASATVVSATVNAFVFGSFAVNVALATSLNFLWSMINC